MESNLFKELVENKLLPFMREHYLVSGSIIDSQGNKAVIKRDKYGFYKIKLTNVIDKGLDG